jgi:hypothetical protein
MNNGQECEKKTRPDSNGFLPGSPEMRPFALSGCITEAIHNRLACVQTVNDDNFSTNRMAVGNSPGLLI